ncbi:MAG: sulfate reduction electron transfer complex DsrMKJOP subunit DsrM [Deltaproteobacteria bacterium]|nr:sulfate reduction electron transfer complex DsrMKJOP subunit DsrM [Deltaproteobacteria bacterium]
MYAVVSVLTVLVLMAIALAGVAGAGLDVLFGVIIPYAALITFFVGVAVRVMDWAGSPVPFRIPTTGGQQKTLPWIKQSKLDNPYTGGQAFLRMVLEVLTFRSLFRNTKLDFRQGPVIRYSSEKFLWLFALMFHYAFLVVLLRHLRFFLTPTPEWVLGLEALDGFFEVGLPQLLLSGVILFGAVGLLFTRRMWIPTVRYISLPADYFPLFLIMFIALTGIAMRYLLRVDVTGIKELTMGLATFHPTVPENLSPWFYCHLFLVCCLIAYFPFSKLMHLGGVFLSPTRNLANNSRAKRHINPWNPPDIKPHSYAAYEDDFREEMVEAGIPVDKELEPAEGDPAEGEEE